jgi:hypothetical protein
VYRNTRRLIDNDNILIRIDDFHAIFLPARR